MIIGVDGNEANVENRVGSGQYTFELLKQFAKISKTVIPAKAGIQNRKILDRVENDKSTKFVIYLKEFPLSDLPQQTPNFKYKTFGPKKLWTQIALPLNLKFGEKLNVFFSPAHYGPRFSKIPYVVTIHDLSYLHFPEMFKGDDLIQLTSWSKYSIEKSAHIIAPSQSTKDDIVKNYKVPASKITVTYEGYDENRFKPQSKASSNLARKKYKIVGDYIIFVGTLQPRKNIERLIEAFYQIISDLTPGVSKDDLNLVIAGKKGWLYESIFEKVKQLKIEDKVIFTGFVSDEDLPALISGAKLYINPSLWEGFGIPVIEAQACGIAVVVSKTSSLPEIVGAEHTPGVSLAETLHTPGVRTAHSETSISGSAILVDPENVDSIANGIKKVLIDETTRSDLVKHGFENVKRFSWETCAKETLSVLAKFASK